MLAKKIYHKFLFGGKDVTWLDYQNGKTSRVFGFSRKGRAHGSTAWVVVWNIGPGGRKLGGKCRGAYEYLGAGHLLLEPP